jgi:hypothetical protein
VNPNHFSSATAISPPALLAHSVIFWLRVLPRSMVASHPDMFKPSTVDESKLLKLVENRFLPDRAVLQCWLAKREDIPTPNTKEIVVLTSL